MSVSHKTNDEGMKMNQQNERNYAALMLDVYGWLKEYRGQDGNFFFRISQRGEYLFQGRGNRDAAPSLFYVELAKRIENRSCAWLEFYVDTTISHLTKIRFAMGWQSDAGIVNPEYKKLGEKLGLGGGQNQGGSLEIVNSPDKGQQKDALLAWLAKYVADFAECLKDLYVYADGAWEKSQEDRISRLISDGYLQSSTSGELSIPENAYSQGEPADLKNDGGQEEHAGHPPSDLKTGSSLKYNRLVFGAPGTGKSFMLEDERRKDEDFKTNYERVTFHPAYSYAQFVGTYKPTMKEDEIAYRFVPGPFLRLLVKAVASPDKRFLLLIEEINRANAAAVFGDVFQLLDRKDGVSEYPIAASEDVRAFLTSELDKLQLTSGFGMTKDNGKWTGECVLSLPQNFYIWATMNSADQGVYPLDTAFKRRWEFEYIGVDGQDLLTNAADAKHPVKWEPTRRFLNRLLVLHNVNEDKLMGPHFVKVDASGNVTFAAFASKVLMYIWEDAARMCRRQLFGEEIRTYSKLIEEWRRHGVEIFSQFSNVMSETGVGGKDNECKTLYKKLTDQGADGAAAN